MAEPQQNRSQHVPAAAVGRILLQVLLDLRHQIFQRLRGIGGARALGKRKISKPRRAERQIDRQRKQRQPHQRQHGCDAAQRHVRLCRRPPRLIGDGKQAPANLHPRSLGLAGPTRPVAASRSISAS